MKKLLLIPALLGTMAAANDYKYEVTPVIGYNIAEGNLNLKNDVIGGLEVKFNDVDSVIKPELSVLGSSDVKSKDLSPSDKTDILRFAVNGVYEYEQMDKVIPFAKAGIGYETIDDHFAENTDGLFADIGAGIKAPVTENIALKLETIYSLKYNKHTAGGNLGDSNLAVLAGLNFAFGKKAQPEPVDGDDDNDGVLNSVDECPTTPVDKKVDATGCCIDGDDDKDGVLNSMDICPTTPAGKEVDSKGCCVVVDGDDDNDGVLNSVDQCPNTPSSVTKVDEEGCAATINLHIKFEFDSYKVTPDSLHRIKEFGLFMNERKNYTATIVGHTDNKGSESYNQKLSEKRAKVVTDLIISEGNVDANRLTSVGKGESEPMVSNDTRENRAQNRRTVAELSKN